MSTYSFLDVSCSMVGPGIIANLANGAAAAEEGITIEPAEDKNIMNIGADGRGQHSLVASDAATITIRLLKTSSVNAILMAAFELQSASSSLWGVNSMTLSNTQTGDFVVIQGAAFKKRPTLTYAKEAGMNEWTFDAIKVNALLGVGTPQL